MYGNADAGTTPSPHSRRTYASHAIKLHQMRIGGGLYRAQDKRTGLTLGYVERLESGVWLARSKSQTYRTTHRTRAGAVLALASYGRMRTASARQERYAKVVRAAVEADAHKHLTIPQLDALHRFLETHPKMQGAGWWCAGARTMRPEGWVGFKACLRRDGLTSAFMHHYAGWV